MAASATSTTAAGEVECVRVCAIWGQRRCMRDDWRTGDGLARAGPHPLAVRVHAASTRAATGATPGGRGRALARSGGGGWMHLSRPLLHPYLLFPSLPLLLMSAGRSGRAPLSCEVVVVKLAGRVEVVA
ncbi:hypothetical protein FIBSPDRAFT_849528 [Athelia psychrophila]|uniref:Uncharacterized protein n=1 Tax=Athelia psychrophila TaxID=1759441 RepID=A0A166UCN8_9AGAM|nr:hypothetical protein FIBSPDRAFT_849528 [Fibularhizoctonia sp. CBS 109695]